MMRFLLGMMFLMVGGCGRHDAFKYHDPTHRLNAKAYEKILSQPSEEVVFIKKNTSSHEKIPEKFYQKVTFATTQEMGLKDVLMTLSSQAGVGISLHPDVAGKVTYYAKKQPFWDVFTSLCQQMNLRYERQGDHLFVAKDTPYLKTYTVPFLMHLRENETRLAIASDGGSQGEDKDLTPSLSGSSTLLSTKTKADFWQELHHNMALILEGNEKAYSFHRQGGLLMVKATQAQHKHIQTFLQRLKTQSCAQVLIEAKVLEVHLKDAFQSGIKWHVLSRGLGLKLDNATPNALATNARHLTTFSTESRHFSGLISLLEHFGTYRTLSSPRILATHNLPSVIKAAVNRVFFTLEMDRTTSFTAHTSERETYRSQLKTIPEGLILVVQPSIHLDSGRITLSLRPTLTSIVGEKEDPAVRLHSKGEISSKIPEVQVREMSSVLEVSSGEIAVIGGLMEQKGKHLSAGLPGKDAPYPVQSLLKHKNQEHQVTELVIFIKATLIDPETGKPIQYRHAMPGSKDTSLLKTFSP